MKKMSLLALMLALALTLLSACSTEQTNTTATAAPVATQAPTEEPTAEPTQAPTEEPTAEPTQAPTEEPTAEPTEAPAEELVAEPALLSVEATDAEAATDAETATDAEASEEATAGEAVLGTAYDSAVQVTLREAQADYDEQLSYYIDYYSQYGYSMDEYDLSFQQNVAQEIVQTLLCQKIVEKHAADLGFVITPEREEELLAQAQTTYDSVYEYYESYLSYYGYSGEALAAIAEEEIAAAGYSVEALYESLKLQEVLDFVYGVATEGTEVTEEEVKAAYDEKIEAQKTGYADVDAFISDYLSGDAEILYTPENLRLIHTIYIAIDENEATPGEATAAEATADEATADEAEDIANLTGYAKATAVLEQIQNGADFAEMMYAYNEDTSTQEMLDLGYPVAEGTLGYEETFTNAALALEHVGDVSEVIVTDYGYFILKYAADMTPGAVDLETRKDVETEEALLNKKNDLYSAYIDTMIDEAGMEVLDLSPLYHVYESNAVEATIAYATVTAEAELTDMPAGDAVAKLSVGATLDVLGRIGMDGEEYIFAAVPGTAYKGYVNVASIADTDEATALSADNAALCAAADALDKKPTFTIVMNDGGVIYGELYPEIAPESVGNFAALANQGYYNGLIFHRVIADFMIQGGDPNGDGTGGPGYAIKGEFASNGVENTLSHTRGVLSMARSSAMDSAGSQFFIMHADNDYLDGDYAAFGMVLGGIETVDQIASQATNSNDKPMDDQTMREVYVETYGKTYEFSKLED